MRISDALLYAIYKNGNNMSSPELLDYTRQLEEYGMVQVDDDGVSYRLTEKAIGRLRDISMV